MSIDGLEAIFTRLGDIEKSSSTAHTRIEGKLDRINDRIDNLAEKVKVQNGRVGRLESQVGELQMQARIAEHELAEDDVRHNLVAARIWQFVSGAGLVALGALLGYFL